MKNIKCHQFAQAILHRGPTPPRLDNNILAQLSSVCLYDLRVQACRHPAFYYRVATHNSIYHCKEKNKDEV